MTPDDIAQDRALIREYRDFPCKPSEEIILAHWGKALDALEHAIRAEGDHLSIASRRMVETVMGERDALRQKVRDLEVSQHESRETIERLFAWAAKLEDDGMVGRFIAQELRNRITGVTG